MVRIGMVATGLIAWAHGLGLRAMIDGGTIDASLDVVANLLIKDNPTRQQTGNLLENDSLTFAFNSHYILLVLLGRSGIHSVNKLPLLVSNLAYDARNRRAVYMHVKYIQENADAQPRRAILSYRHHGSDFSVRR